MLIDTAVFLERIPGDAKRLLTRSVDAWLDAARKRGSMPTRQDMGPAQLRGISEYVSLFDYDGQSKLIFRLASRDIIARLRQAPIGFNSLDILSPALRPTIERRLQLAASQPCGYAPCYLVQDPKGDQHLSITIMLPLAGDVPDKADHYMRVEYIGNLIDWSPHSRDEVFVDKAGSFGTAFDLGHGLPAEFSDEMQQSTALMNAGSSDSE
ncbi:PAS domain-containing protein [Gimibacter soli]|uniref:PAS domain-containing protein n=1 Tax=Gimibacter soli TaxID=3024400 RepID=A0AAE9XW59_9PROT|nr:PAS domain-containing protein [Gimibacter soli]WCL55368.1 PAS domain-containing protein [Gimibacter soli]